MTRIEEKATPAFLQTKKNNKMSAAIKVNPTSIKNKIKREDVHHRVKVEKAKAKRVRRQQLKKEEEEDPEKKEERLKKNVPKTLENTREFDETIVQEDNEVAEDEATDEFAKYFGGQAPKILITTSKCPSAVDNFPFACKIKHILFLLLSS